MDEGSSSLEPEVDWNLPPINEYTEDGFLIINKNRNSTYMFFNTDALHSSSFDELGHASLDVQGIWKDSVKEPAKVTRMESLVQIEYLVSCTGEALQIIVHKILLLVHVIAMVSREDICC